VILPFIVVGLTAGSIYGLAGVGLVLTYKTSGIMNLGYGALGASAAYVFYWLHIDQGIAWPLALLLSVLVWGMLLGWLFERFARLASRMPTSLQIAGTAGIVLLVEGLLWEWKGTGYKAFPQFLPSSTFTVFDAHVGYNQVIVIVVGLVATALLYLMLHATRLGFAMRGVVDDPDLVALSGTSPVRVRLWASVIGLVLACLAGVLLGPSTTLDVTVLTQLVVQAFGAAAVGYFSNLPLTYLGGLLIGVAASVSTKYISATSPLQGLPPSIPFIVLFAALIFVKRERLVQRATAVIKPAEPWRTPVSLRALGGVAVLAVLLLVPTFAGAKMSAWQVTATYIVLFLSLGLLVKTSNQVSLCHVAFAAIGASTFVKLTGHMPWVPSLLLAGLVVVPIGAAVAIPAIRVSGVYLALATLAFGIMVQYIFYQTNLMFGANLAAANVPRPSTLQSDNQYYYLLLVIALIVTVGLVVLHRTRLGRLLRGLGDSRLALSTLGLSPNITLVLVFCVSAFLAGIFGALYGAALFSVSGDSFPFATSLTWVVVLSIVAGTLPWYALLAAFGWGVFPAYVSISINWITALFGAFAIMHAMIGTPTPPEWLKRWLISAQRREETLAARMLARRRRKREPRPLPAGPSAPATGLAGVNGNKPGLEISGLSVRFAGVVAVDGLSLSARTGHITGLIGPNGAGKTTIFNACSGLVRPQAGTVHLFGEDISHLAPAARARRGLGRTFQRMQLFESLTVGENVALGREARLAGNNVLAHVTPRVGDTRTIDAATAQALEICALTDARNRPIATLSTGQRRLVELARCLAGTSTFLLLDEPSSGLDRRETARLGEVLRAIISERGLSILLVEHDMSLVMEVCDHIHVLDFGKHIFEGTPSQVSGSEIVRAAYLGKEEADTQATSRVAPVE
jgi:ABC-type branched-subunit amino acid transport system ATPase component/branched-subunit amino acid ABC-type transport system permease component